MKLILISVAIFASLYVVSSDRIPQNGQPFLDIKRIRLRRQDEAYDPHSQELRVLSQLAQSRALPHRRNFNQRSGVPSLEPKESKSRLLPFNPSPQDPSPNLTKPFEDLTFYRPRPEHRPPRPENRPQNVPTFEADVSRFAEQVQHESRNPEPQDLPVTDIRQRSRPAAFVEDDTLFRKNPERPVIETEPVRIQDEDKIVELLQIRPLSVKESKPSSVERSNFERRRPHFPKQITKSRVPPTQPSKEAFATESFVYPVEDDDIVIIKSSETFDFPKSEDPRSVQHQPQQFENVRQTPELIPITSYEGNPEPPQIFREESPVKVSKRKKVVPTEVRRHDKDFKKEKREIVAAGTNVDPNAIQFAHDVQNAEAGGAAKHGRIAFQLHGLQGPHSYRFGFDTGKGYNRQFRYEERDNYGEVKGRYGYYDNYGKLHLVNYSAHPKHGFAADVPKY